VETTAVDRISSILHVLFFYSPKTYYKIGGVDTCEVTQLTNAEEQHFKGPQKGASMILAPR